ncbi:MAG: transglutaminase domain-containing protein [Dehalococcoidia bacterium]
MSQANWIEYFRTQPVQQDAPPERMLKLPAWVKDWELWLTFGLTLLVFLSVARSIESAHWVEGMPSLTFLSLLAITTGLVLSRVQWPEPFLHLVALVVGAPIVLWMVLGYIHAPTLQQGLSQFWHRYGHWLYLVRTGGISNDVMPFISMVLALTWIAAYLSAWSIFRWRNAWLALIPGGVGLLTNISYLPGQFSVDFVVFLFGAMLLVMRVNMLNREREWQHKGLRYPGFLSLSLLNVTVWVAIALLFVAWSVPLAAEIKPISRTWDALSSPFAGATDWSRLFSSIDSKRDVPLHNFGPTLPLPGKVVLSDRPVSEVDFGDQSNYGRNLRAAVYDEYTPTGWKAGSRQSEDLGSSGLVGGPAADKSPYKDRKEVPVSVIVDTPDQVLLTVGEPVSANLDARAEVINAAQGQDIGAVRPKHALKVGDTYTLTGSISQASVESLEAAGAAYPDWVKGRYLQLPSELPARVGTLATQITTGKASAYDKVSAIQDYLRQLPDTFDIPAVPPDRDGVDYFLFDLKRGYSDYHASAMVVLLRSLGIPARLATGFSVGEFDLNAHRYIVRQKDATSWPEVFFPGYGWEEFSPFGGAPLVNRPSAGGSSGTPDDSQALLKDPNGLDFGDAIDSGNAGSGLHRHQGRDYHFLLYIGFALLAVIALGGVGGLSVRLAWERGMKGLDYPAQLWEKTIRLASWLKLAPKPEQTPAEYSSHLRKSVPKTEGVELIADRYLRSRYGHKDLDAADRQRLGEAWAPVRNQLIRRILRWKS